MWRVLESSDYRTGDRGGPKHLTRTERVLERVLKRVSMAIPAISCALGSTFPISIPKVLFNVGSRNASSSKEKKDQWCQCN